MARCPSTSPCSPWARAVVCAAVLTVLLAGVPSRVRADGLQEFQDAVQAYEDQEFQTAAKRFEDLVGGQVPSLSDPGLIEESRKYLGATYVYLGKRSSAEEQFRRLLEQRPTYPLDPHDFPPEVHQVFDAVRDDVQRDIEEEQQERQAEEERERERLAEELLEQEQRMERLRELASEKVVEEENSRWIAMLPFGVGQFQNGHDGLGLGLAVTEGLLVAVSIGTAIWHAAVTSDPTVDLGAGGDELRGQRLEQASRYMNWSSMGLLAGVAIAGIIDAQVRFVPSTRKTEKRELPEDLLESREPEGPEASIGVWPGGATLRVNF